MKKMFASFIILLIIIRATVGQNVGSHYIKISEPIANKYKYNLYAPILLDSNIMIATRNINGKEDLVKYEYGKSFGEIQVIAINAATGGSVDKKPYYYLPQADVLPIVKSDLVLNTDNDEVWVFGSGDMIFAVIQNKSLDICTVKKIGGNLVYKISKDFSLNNRDEHDLYIYNNKIVFSAKDSSGYYQLYKSSLIKNNDSEEFWTVPEKLPIPYNNSRANNMFYTVDEDGIEYVSSDRDGRWQIYAISDEYKLSRKFGNKTYEIYSLADAYGFPNIIVDLTEEQHKNNDTSIVENRNENSDQIDLNIESSYINKTFTEDEIKHIFGTYKISFQYVQIGVYSNGKEPNFPLWFSGYDVRSWLKDKYTKRWLIWSKNIDESFIILKSTITVFSKKNVKDNPFIFIMIKNDENKNIGFDVVTMENNQFVIKHHELE